MLRSVKNLKSFTTEKLTKKIFQISGGASLVAYGVGAVASIAVGAAAGAAGGAIHGAIDGKK